jgi:hypothetical protein
MTAEGAHMCCDGQAGCEAVAQLHLELPSGAIDAGVFCIDAVVVGSTTPVLNSDNFGTKCAIWELQVQLSLT